MAKIGVSLDLVRIVAVVLFAMASFGGCSEKSPRISKSDYVNKVHAGMTLSEVESALGDGEVVAFNDLPEFYRKAMVKVGESGIYRRWSRKDGNTTTTIHVEFKDGKAEDPLIEQVIR
jgi:hypothetical protein